MIDAHMHFWDPVRWDYPWLHQFPALNRRHAPGDLDFSGSALDAVVFVEAGGGQGDSLAEVAWVEQLAQRWPVVAGIVAHAPLEFGAEASHMVQQLGRRTLVKGIRRNLQDETNGFATTAHFRAGVRLLADYGLVADLCVRERQLGEITELVRSTPEVTFVLDHLGKPRVRIGQWQPWADNLARLAEQPNVFVKLSGLATEAEWVVWTAEQTTPYLEHALAVFGPQRCMFGGDWPVSTLSTTYSRWYDAVAGVVGSRTPTEQALVLGGVAEQVYRLSISRETPTAVR